VGLLNRRYGKSIKGISPAVLERLLVHPFHGNIRELENIIEHAFIFCQSGEIELAHLPEELSISTTEEKGRALRAFSSFDELEAQYLRAVLEETGGSRIDAAKRLGIHKSTLFRKLKKLGIQKDD
jgi:DNA-binding NtrC family response regulator